MISFQCPTCFSCVAPSQSCVNQLLGRGHPRVLSVITSSINSLDRHHVSTKYQPDVWSLKIIGLPECNAICDPFHKEFMSSISRKYFFIWFWFVWSIHITIMCVTRQPNCRGMWTLVAWSNHHCSHQNNIYFTRFWRWSHHTLCEIDDTSLWIFAQIIISGQNNSCGKNSIKRHLLIPS